MPPPPPPRLHPPHIHPTPSPNHPPQARFLVDHPQQLAPLAVAALLAIKGLGYLMFRGANSQKDLFRRDPRHPRAARLRTLPTRRGTRLITSGWWGIARHINYFGDWVMACVRCVCGVGGEGGARLRHCWGWSWGWGRVGVGGWVMVAGWAGYRRINYFRGWVMARVPWVGGWG